MPGGSSSMRLRWSGWSSTRSWHGGPAAGPRAGSSPTELPSVRDADVLAVVDRALDLVDDRQGEVGAGDVRTARGVEERHLAADAVPARALTRRPGAVGTRRAHEQPVQAPRGALGQQDPRRLALQCLRAVLLVDVALD